MQKTIIIAAIAIVGLVKAGLSTGSCPVVPLQANFDAVKYMGVWNEQLRDSGMPFESDDCQQARYSINPDGTVAVFNTQYDPIKDEVTSAAAVATFNGAQGKVKFFPYAPAGDYRVLYTDYANVALVYSCDVFLVAKTEYVWILTRSQTPSDAFVFQALNILKERVPAYDQTQLRKTLHGSANGCKYYQAPATMLE